MDKIEYIALSWDEIYDLLLKLAKEIIDDNYRPDLIVGICRGGWVVARVLSDLLDIKEVANIRVEFYEDLGLTRDSPCITQDISVDVRGKKVILCDDVADTGKSLKIAADYLRNKGVSDLKISTLHFKPKSIVFPDYYVSKTSAWIIYPWEVFETIKSIIRKLKKEGKSSEQIEKELIRTKINPKYIKIFMDWIKTVEKYSSCNK
ncbi:MAG: phosphoribosyltransferase [Candidatus Jordarchaeum sp.]|uniref:phosphoribosyltransferase n=1 Tax=Candidatus Jordarchaeum sp. TaxID=2823881 RepID=UPI00404AECE9